MTTAITLISTIVTTVATVLLAHLTSRYVRLTQQMVQSMESAREPFVDIELDLPSMDLRFAFVNAGGTTARNIMFRVDQDCDLIQGHQAEVAGIGSMHPIRNGISYLPAGQRLIYSAGYCPSNISSSTSDPHLHLTISYENDGGRVFSRTVHYDLRQIDHLLFETFNNSHAAVAKAIRETEERAASRNVAKKRLEFLSISRSVTSCPFCLEKITRAAKKCHYCLEWIKPSEAQCESESETQV